MSLIGEKYGCLEVLDDGQEYLELTESKISKITEEKLQFKQLIEENKLLYEDFERVTRNRIEIVRKYIYKPINFQIQYKSTSIQDFDNAINKLQNDKHTKRYKCQCKKCGKIRYYSLYTLQQKNTFCFQPIYCSSKFTYSINAKNATYRKQQKYSENEAVVLVSERQECVPSDEYCGKWNEKRKKELIKQAEKEAAILAEIPRKLADNFDVNYVGRTYESLYIEDCVNDRLESTPEPYYNQQHKKYYRDIIVFKQYRCKCYLCGKEHIITCDKFGIYPPTSYGYTAYNGYWSKVKCDCHDISSFQWIVNKLLFEANIKYRVEYHFSDLLGSDNIHPLRFDFAILDENENVKALIECQGEQHYKPVESFGGIESFKKQQKYDEKKRQYAKMNNIPLIEISYKYKKIENIRDILIENNILKKND